MQRVGIGILDWGLGHAARMVPVILRLSGMDKAVVLMGSGASGAWLRQRFPQLEYHTLPAAEVLYGCHAAWDILRQWPALARAEAAENKWLNLHLEELKLDGLISDNRYGLHHHLLPCVLITHQLAPRAPCGLHAVAARLMARKLRNFDEVWIPDRPGPSSLAGAMAVNPFFSGKTQHIGWLSRFENLNIPDGEGYENLGLVSGPETQRTLFQEALEKEFRASGKPSLIVCGLPATPFDKSAGNVRLVHHLEDRALAEAIAGANRIVARPGYSTIMDLMALGRTADWVPTPGQTEQEYLAKQSIPSDFSKAGPDLSALLSSWMEEI